MFLRPAVPLALLAIVLFTVPTALAACPEDEPDASVSVGALNPTSGSTSVVISHNKPDTLSYTWLGVTTTPVLPSDGSPITVTLGGYCRSQTDVLRVVVTKCGKSRTVETSVAPPDTTPQLVPKVELVNGATYVHVNFFLPAGSPGPLKATLTGLDGKQVVVHNEASTYATTGARTVYSGRDSGFLYIETKSCTGIATGITVPLQPTACSNCKPCNDCVGEPVHTLSGNMQYVEADPLPGFEILPFIRAYDSASSYDGHFGHRWSSVFDAKLSTFTTMDSRELVSLRTERGVQFLFRGENGGFVQTMPSAPAPGTLQRATDGTWMHRDAGGSLLRIFSSDGRPMAYRDLRSGNEIRLVWTNGKVSGVTDSWGRWSLHVTTEATSQRVTSIALDGPPQLVWTYIYSENRLIRVDSPLGPWRSYIHEYHPTGNFWYPIKEVRDGQGKLIESHNYRDKLRASDSISATDDVTSIGSPGSGRVTGELKTTISYRTGRQEQHYRRFVANEYRLVEIDGGCTSCNARHQVFAYDAKGRLERVQNGDGYVTEEEYVGTTARVMRRRTALRPSTCDPATAQDRCRQTPEALDTIALMATSATVTTEYEYNDAHWPDRPTVTRVQSVLNPAGKRVETLSFDPINGAIVTQAVRGWTGSPAIEQTRTVATALYGANETAAFEPGGNVWDSAWSQLPQPSGLRKSVDGPRTDVSDVTSFVYYPVDDAVPSLLRGRLAVARNAAGHLTRYEDYDAFGNARRVVDANGVAMTLQFDLLGRATATTLEGIAGCDTFADPLCATALGTSRVWTPSGLLTSETKAGGGTTTYTYDSLRRVSTVSRTTTGSVESERITYAYDPATGRKSSEILSVKSGASWVEKTRTSYTYDLFGQLKRTTHADSTFLEYAYDEEGRMATARDENHSAPNTFYSYDPAGRLREVRQTLANGFAVTLYGYDAHHNLSSVTDPNGNVTTYAYDDFGQLLSQTSPVTGTTTYAYDAAGQLTQTEDANGTTVTRTYDVLGRVLSTVSVKDAETESVSWTYDGTATPFGIGRTATMTDPTGSTRYAYERRGLLTLEEKTIGSAVYTTRFGYDTDANRNRMQYPGGRVVDYGFDRAGRPVSASTNGAALVTSASYLPFGPRTETVFANGARRVMDYDTRYRPDGLRLIGPSSTLVSYDYQHDHAGNITGILDLLDTGYDRHFGYDDLNRLTSANTGAALWGTGSYQYDAMGNVQQSTLGAAVSTFTYSGVTPVIASVTANGVTRIATHDPAGNETIFGAASSYYSPRNFMRETGNLQYAYDGRGIRTVTTTVTGERYSLYTPELALLAETQTTATSTKPVAYEYVWFDHHPLAQIETSTGTVSWYFTDHLATPILQIDASAQIVWRADYDPYGTVHTFRTGATRHQPLRFPGQESHGSELSYNVFRWYRAGWGRYTSSDPLGLAAGMNLYAYVDANPVNYSDPLGLIKPVHPSKQKYRPCNNDEIQKCQASCKYGMESCMVSQTFKIIKMTGGKTLYGWVDGPMSCSCKEPSCWEQLKEWADPKNWFDSNPTPPLPPFLPIPPKLPTPKPVIPGLPPFFVNPCMLNPSLCYGDTGIA
ncbi:MAG TPA: RHS repeat-associated core domain-containing protein [Thermoanaerobaculia bacterium]|nr:RHS repeat-associated core domain-containing protein [Thermoanaerobaculia bacterium]